MLIGFSQDMYIEKILNPFNLQDSKIGFFPMSTGITLKNQWATTLDEQKRMSAIIYASALRSIMYAMIFPYLDVFHALSVASRFQSDYNEAHWTVLNSIPEYFWRTKNVFLVFGGKDELTINGYTDASFQTDNDGLGSQFDFVFCLNGGQWAISVPSKTWWPVQWQRSSILQYPMLQKKLFG